MEKVFFENEKKKEPTKDPSYHPIKKVVDYVLWVALMIFLNSFWFIFLGNVNYIHFNGYFDDYFVFVMSVGVTSANWKLIKSFYGIIFWVLKKIFYSFLFVIKVWGSCFCCFFLIVCIAFAYGSYKGLRER